MRREVAIGIGCKSDASAEAILRAVAEALDRARGAFDDPDRHCERSEAIQGPQRVGSGLLRCARNDGTDSPPALTGLYSHERKRQHPGLLAAAAALESPLRCFTETELTTADPRLLTRSARVAKLTGVGSVAEAAALLGAGADARLVVAKFSADGVSCAVAAGGLA